jgi:hypothetical protein
MAIRERLAQIRLGRDAGVALFIAGITFALADATQTSPTWAEGWGGIVVAILSACLIILGLYLILQAPESPGHRLARLFRPLINEGQLLYQDAGLPDARPEDVHKDFADRVRLWETRAISRVAKYADDYSAVLATAISGDMYLRDLPGWRRPFDAQHHRLARSLRVLRSIADGTPPRDIDFDAGRRVLEGIEDRLEERMVEDDQPSGIPMKLVWTAAELALRRTQRATLERLRAEARRHVADWGSLSLAELATAHAEEWLDTWTFEVRQVLAPDAPGLARFDGPIEDVVSGKDWRQRPLIILTVRLSRLEAIAGDAYWEGPTAPDGDDTVDDSPEEREQDRVPPFSSRAAPVEPTAEDVKARAELLLAQFRDAIGTDSSPHFGPRAARIMARNQLREEQGIDPGSEAPR